MPAVSVIMPVFNGARYINTAIDSILKQSFQDIELIVVDDGSRDGTANIVSSIGDKRVKYIYQENQGSSSAINRGMQIAKGNLIAHCDCDDIWNREKLKKQVAILETDLDIVLAGTWAIIIDEQGKRIGTHKHTSKSRKLKLELIFRNPFVHSSILYRKNVAQDIGGYLTDSDHAPPEDYEFITRMATKGKIINIEELLVRYRHHDCGVSKRQADQIRSNSVEISRLYIAKIDSYKLAQAAQYLAMFAIDHSCPTTVGQARDLLLLTSVLKEKMFLASIDDWIWFIILVLIATAKKIVPLKTFRAKMRRIKI
jgi:glycosyltransferase involved in cell wall biosynthesis